MTDGAAPESIPRCEHGGASFEAIGERFTDLGRRERVIAADVLDAWFEPAPGVLDLLREHLEWLVRTSPPTDCGGLVHAVAQARGVEPACVLPGGGSSDLIFLALRRWLSPDSRALILDPMYGEYAHVLERVIGCELERLHLARGDGYRLDPDRLERRIGSGDYDFVALVNPNSPPGRHVPRERMEGALSAAPAGTRVWIDETYVDYVGREASLERYAAGRENVVVCKSMSKVYALSGMRVGYLCGAPGTVDPLRAHTPPWSVGLPAQVAAVQALREEAYYAERWRDTHRLRGALERRLGSDLGLDPVPGVANFLLCHLPEEAPTAAVVVERSRERGLFLRDVAGMGSGLGSRALRIAVKDADTQRRMVAILSDVLGGGVARPAEA